MIAWIAATHDRGHIEVALVVTDDALRPLDSVTAKTKGTWTATTRGKLTSFLGQFPDVPLAGIDVDGRRMLMPHALWDASTIELNGVRDLAKRWRPRIFETEPQFDGVGGALGAVQHAIEVAKHYRDALFLADERG